MSSKTAELDALSQLSQMVRMQIGEGTYETCAQLICDAMHDYPHAPHPHNWMGVLLETQGNPLEAVRHFRAAWALDPTYLPCRVNLSRYGSFFGKGPCVYDEQDCTQAAMQEIDQSRNENQQFKRERNDHGYE